MDLGIKGKWALVCGASKGLGYGCAISLAQEGVNLVINARSEQPLREGARYGFGTAAVSVCGFEYGLRQLSALGLTSHREPVSGA